VSHDRPAHPPTEESPGDLRFHRLNWAACRAARIYFLLLILAAVLGLFGHGPLASVTARAGGIELSHDRFVREQGRFGVRLTPDTNRVTLVLHGIVDARDQAEWSPEPVSESMSGSERRLVFEAQPGQETIIEVRWTPRLSGVHRGTIQVAGESFGVWAMVYP
jgi:hypothetical protein